MIINKIKLQVNFKSGKNCNMPQNDVTTSNKTDD